MRNTTILRKYKLTGTGCELQEIEKLEMKMKFAMKCTYYPLSCNVFNGMYIRFLFSITF